MSLTVRHEIAGDVDVITLCGDVDLSTLPRLTDALNRVVADGHQRVVVDLEAITVIDDAALGILLGVASRLRRMERQLVVVCANSRIVDHLASTGVATLIPVVESLGHLPTIPMDHQ